VIQHKGAILPLEVMKPILLVWGDSGITSSSVILAQARIHRDRHGGRHDV
jgi:hypothetical protein